MNFKVSLTAVSDVKDFVEACIAAPFNVDVGSSRHIVDGKSLMGLFSLDLSKPVEVNCLDYDKATDKTPYENFKKKVNSCIVE